VDLKPSEVYLGLWYCRECEKAYHAHKWRVIRWGEPDRPSRIPKETPDYGNPAPETQNKEKEGLYASLLEGDEKTDQG